MSVRKVVLGQFENERNQSQQLRYNFLRDGSLEVLDLSLMLEDELWVRSLAMWDKLEDIILSGTVE